MKRTETRPGHCARTLAVAGLIGAIALALSACVPGAGPHPPGHRGVGHPGPAFSKLKPKEKARLGLGRHAGHPHGGPPGQRKKLRW